MIIWHKLSLQQDIKHATYRKVYLQHYYKPIKVNLLLFLVHWYYTFCFHSFVSAAVMLRSKNSI